MPDVPPLGERAWGDTQIVLPGGLGVRPRYQNVFTDRCVAVHHADGRARSCAPPTSFERFPVAVLT